VNSNWKGLERSTCTGTNLAYFLLDMNADARADLVVTRDCADLSVGQSHWEVFSNEGTRFAADATLFGLPEAAQAYPYNALERKTCSAGTAGVAYATRDLDGNGIPDLAVLQDCADASVGATHWRVHLGQGGAFQPTPTLWTLPPSADGIAYTSLDRTTCGATNGTGFAYALRDMNGDGAPDLLVYDDCGDDSVGSTHWNVYLAGSDGFATDRTAWTLPTPPANHPFALLDRTSCDTVNDVGYAYSLRDMTGDGKPDLLVYEDCSNPEVGVSHWAVFRGTETGFEANAARWSLPPSAQAFTELERTSCSQTSASGFTVQLVDMNGDDRPDLLTALDCTDGTVGITHWDVYEAGESGFAPEATRWPLPEPAPNQRWSSAQTTTCTGQNRSFVLREMDGDGRPDLVVYSDCASALVGLSRWHVYGNTCETAEP
jgi:hypothetical protein